MTLSKSVRRTTMVMIALSGVLFAIAIAPVESAKSGAALWVHSLSAAQRLEYLRPDRISGLPKPYRMALFATLSTGEERAAFWRGVFSEYRRTHSMSASQVEVVQHVETALTAEMFATKFDETRNRQVAELRQALSAALGPDVERDLVYSGGSEMTSALPRSELIRYHWRNGRPNQVVALVDSVVPGLLAWACDCNESSDCSYQQHCPNHGEGDGCEYSDWGCGPFNWQACWAKCTYAVY